MSRFSRSAVVLVAMAVSSSALQAQRGRNPGLREVGGGIGNKWHLGFALAQPQGQFAQGAAGYSPGLDLGFTSGGPLGIRLEGTVLVYGSERWLIPSGGSSYSDMHANNFIGSVGIGPQLTLGRGSIRMYAYGTIGFSYFSTISWGDGCDCDGWSRTEYDDAAPARTVGGGLQVGLTRSWFLDLSARYMHHGTVSYLMEGDVGPDGTRAEPRTSEANLMVYRIGFSFGGR